ncbi:unnamed protein product [Heterobilharzia americana]|nr:unnamed protein product [Heterobilharzia americana]
MQLIHLKTLIPTQECEAKVQCIAWSPNNKKLAICTSDRLVIVFDENGERRARFSTKTVNSKTSGKYFQVNGVAFSHDSTKLAIAQSDNMIFVYKIGETWDDKKVICNKFLQKSPATCVIWPPGQPIICGLADGKVRAANARTNKSSTVYNSESYVVSIAMNVSGKGFISGHADGRIIRYFFDDEGSGDTQGKFTVHPTAPYALAWAGSTVLAAGCDKRIYVYNREGKVVQQFDYSRDDTEKEFVVASCNPSGHAVAFGSFNRIRVLLWSPYKGGWDECQPKEIENIYTITAIAWKQDGSKLTVGTYCGGVELFDCCMKKKLYRNIFELNYVGPSQVIVKNLKTGETIVLHSFFGYEIDDVRVMGQDRYLIAHTSNTLMLGDLRENRLSEVQWNSKNLKERFYFGYNKFCIIFGPGELHVIEYGANEILGSVRTEFTTPYLVSVRIDERKSCKDGMCKRIAYMMDLKTISVVDLVTGLAIVQVPHDKKIDWIELNETGQKLLFRDRKLQLILFDIITGMKYMLLSFCYYVQWVPQSDVIVAQSRDDLCIWYNIETIDRMTAVPLKGGEIVDIIRQHGKTEVLVSEGMTSVTYSLDDGLIEFGTAMEDGDFERAVLFLEGLETCSNLMENKSCDLNVRACVAILEKEFRVAEDIFLSQNSLDNVIKLYKDLLKWDNAIEIAEAKAWSGLDKLRKNISYG